MTTPTTTPTPKEFTDDQIRAIMTKMAADILLEGKTPKESFDFPELFFEFVYESAYENYTNGKYDLAEALLHFLCQMDFKQERYWQAYGGALQMQKQYAQALAAYTAAVMINIENPDNHFRAAQCMLALGQKEGAKGALNSAIGLAGPQWPYKGEAEALLNLVNKK